MSCIKRATLFWMCENSASFYRQGGSCFCLMLWLAKIWQVSSCRKFMQFMNTCLTIAEAYRILCHHLVIIWTVFLHWMYEMKYSCYQDSCYSWLVCLLGFWLRNALLVKVIRNPIKDGIVFVFRLAWCIRGFKRLKRYCPYLLAF